MKVKVGFIGVGGIAHAHLSNLAKMDEVEIAGLYDVDSQRVNKIAEEFNTKAYESIKELVRADVIDALFVCSPPFARGEIEQIAAAAGIHLFVEKPLGLDMATARVKEEAVLKSGVIHSSGYCLRYLDIVQKAKAYLQGKQIDLVNGYKFGGMHAPFWWRQLDQSGGQLVDQTTHAVDLIRYLAGEIAEVYSVFERRAIREVWPDSTIYDVGIVSLRLQSGAVGSIMNSCMVPSARGRFAVEFIGHDFDVIMDDESLTIKDDTQDIRIVSETDCLFLQDHQFIRSIQTGEQDGILCDYSEALKTLAVTLAANESALGGAAIRVN